MNPTTIFFIGGVFALVLLIIGIVVSIRSSKSEEEERMGKYISPEEAERIEEIKKTPLTDWINQGVTRSSYGNKIARDLARADLKLKPGEYVIVMFLIGVLVGLVAWFLVDKNLIAGGVGFIVGLFLPGVYVRRLQGKRLIKFSDQLADMLNLMVNGLRAGFSTMQAMEAVSKELPAPISEEFLRVVQEMQLGVPMERALENLLTRIPSPDLDLVVTAINVQREVGGNLAEILDTISYTIRERVRIKGEIRVLTSQTMYSGKFLAMMPLFVIGILYLLNREYMQTFFLPSSQPCGYIGLGLAGVLIMIGYFVMTRIADIEV